MKALFFSCFVAVVIISACSGGNDNRVQVDLQASSNSDSFVSSSSSNPSSNASNISSDFFSVTNTSSASPISLSGRNKEVIVNDFTFSIPVEWSIQETPDPTSPNVTDILSGDTVVASMICPIPGWDAGLGWGSMTASERTFRKTDKVFKASLERYTDSPGPPTFVLYVHESDLETLEGAQPSCAFLAGGDVGKQMEEIYLSIR